MANVLRNAVIGCALAGTLVLAAAAPSLAQGIYVDPYAYGAPQGYAGYSGYAYVPGYASRWDYPAGYDTSGMAYSYRDLVAAGTQWYPLLSHPARAEPLLDHGTEQDHSHLNHRPEVTSGRWFTSFAESH